MSTFDNKHFASAIIWWLNYVVAVGREYTLNEGAIKFPAAEFLERFFRDNISLEFKHPKLHDRSIDLYFKDSLNREETAFEFKFIRKDSTRKMSERQRVFNDLMRMHLFLDKNKRGFFLICGQQLHYNSSFKNLILTPTSYASKPSVGFYSKWFSFDKHQPEKIIKLQYARGDYNAIYKKFFKDYKDEHKNPINKPNSIKTRLVYCSEDLNDTGLPANISIGIWEIIN